MVLERTANAGILLALDGVKILFDGVSREGTDYPATSVAMQDQLIQKKPDVLCITHAHPDHFDMEFSLRYKKVVGGTIVAPINESDLCATIDRVKLGDVSVIPIASRHIGKVGINVPHSSFIVEGSSCVWFMGDAAVLQWKNRRELPKPDVLIVPFAYVTTQTSWEITKSLGAKHIVIVHMPDKQSDPCGLWDAVMQTACNDKTVEIWIPDIGESREFL